MKQILTVKHLSKSYNGLKAVSDVSFEVKQGEKFVFVGPNGAGKSTTINILCTLLSKDAGEVVYGDLTLGQDNEAIRRLIGVVFQNHTLDDDLTVRDNLGIRGALYDYSDKEINQRINELESALEINNYIDQRYGTLSGGQKRRADIARALLQKPAILYLDEPTTGLDPQTRRVVWKIISQIREEFGMTVFLTTHYMEETEDADHVVIIDGGKVVASGTPIELKNQYAPTVLKLFSQNPGPLKESLEASGFQPWQSGGHVQISISNSLQALPILEAIQPRLDGFEVINGSMDDVFIAITGREIRA